MNKNYIDREDQSYNAAVDSIHAARLIERKIKRAEVHSALEMAELRRMEEEGVFRPQDREEMNERYKRNLEQQIKLQREKQETLERIAEEYRAYEERRKLLEEQLRNADQEKSNQPLAWRENTILLDEGVRQFLMDVSAVRKANIEALIENNPALKRFVAPESYVRDEIVPGQNVTVLGLAAEITFKDENGVDFVPSLAVPLDGPARGVQAALWEQNDRREVVKIAGTIVDLHGSETDFEAPSYSEPEFSKKLLITRSPEERDELVNGEIKGEALPLQIALAYIDDSKRDRVCIESLKGYGIDTKEIEKDLGLVQEPAKPSINPPKMSPREIEMAHAETLSSETVDVNPELEQEPDLTITREQSLSREI